MWALMYLPFLRQKTIKCFWKFSKKNWPSIVIPYFCPETRPSWWSLTSPISSSFSSSKWEASQVSFLTSNVLSITTTGLAWGAMGEVSLFHLHFLSHKSKCFCFTYIQNWLPSHVRTKHCSVLEVLKLSQFRVQHIPAKKQLWTLFWQMSSKMHEITLSF